MRLVTFERLYRLHADMTPTDREKRMRRILLRFKAAKKRSRRQR